MNIRWLGWCVVALTTLASCRSWSGAESGAGAFPEAWFGKWGGECALHRADGEQVFPMTLEIGPWIGDRCRWRIVYGEGDTLQRRGYDLVVVDAGVGHYAIDENNGIVLDSYLRAGALYSPFEVQGNRLVARYEWVGDAIEFEIIIVDVDAVRTSGGDPVPAVQSFAVPTVQRGTLRRIAAGKNR